MFRVEALGFGGFGGFKLKTVFLKYSEHHRFLGVLQQIRVYFTLSRRA